MKIYLLLFSLCLAVISCHDDPAKYKKLAVVKPTPTWVPIPDERLDDSFQYVTKRGDTIRYTNLHYINELGDTMWWITPWPSFYFGPDTTWKQDRDRLTSLSDHYIYE